MTPPIRICIAILADLPVEALRGEAQGRGAGHAATWLPQLAKALICEGDLEIHWIVLKNDVKRYCHEQIAGQTIHIVPRRSMTIDMVSGHRLARAKMRRVLKSIKPDVIHVWGSESSYPSVLKGAAVPTIMSMQGILSEYDRIGSFRDNWRMRLQAWHEKKWVQQATMITSESEWGMEKVRLIAPHADCRMVEYGVDPSFYDLKWNPDASEPCVLYSGGGDWRKGFDLLMEAMALPPVPAWKCWVAGSCLKSDDAVWKSFPHVEVLGNLKWSEMQERMTRAWGLVLPTRADTSPNAAKEARVIGMPVITSRNGGQAGYIRNQENGIIVDPLSPGKLRAAIDRLLAEYGATIAMGETRHAEDRAYFRPERTADAFSSLYRELAGSRKESTVTLP